MNEQRRTIFTLVGTDEGDEVALFRCENCSNIIPFDLDENGAINLVHMDSTCPECGALILDVYWE